LDHWLIGSLSIAALAVVAVMLVRISGVEPDMIQTPPESSIAVMPFETCDDNTVGLLLAHQLAVEVIDQLSERGMHKVIARTSSFSLEDSGWATPRISKQLGAEYVLFGKVCRDGKNLTIAAELRDKNDIIKLREIYTQAVNKFDQIEVRVTTLLADELTKELGDILQPAREYPVNHLAYEQLLVSREYFSQGDSEQALSSIERALEFQSNYPEAMVWKAFYLFMKPSGEQTVARLENNTRFGEQALGLIKQQLESGTDSFYLRYVAGRINQELGHWNDRWITSQAVSLGEAEIAELKKTSKTRFQQAERHLRSAMVLNPSDTSANIHLANTLEHLGAEGRNEALEIYQQGLKNDPINADLNVRLARRLSDFGRYRQGVELLENLRGLPQVPASVWKELGWINLTHAFFVEYVELNIEMLLTAPDMASGHPVHFLRLLPQLGIREEGQAWYQHLKNMPGVDESSLDDYLLRTEPQDQIIEKWRSNLVELYLKTDRNDDALALLEQTVKHLEAEYDTGIRHPQTLYLLAEAYVYQGQDEAALEMLEKAVDYHARWPVIDARERLYSPWDRLRDDPRFIRQWGRMEMDLEQQAESIRTILSQYNVDEVPAPLTRDTE
jgi:TolB-like protein/Tfp pilus assembly protein PilF